MEGRRDIPQGHPGCAAYPTWRKYLSFMGRMQYVLQRTARLRIKKPAQLTIQQSLRLNSIRSVKVTNYETESRAK